MIKNRREAPGTMTLTTMCQRYEACPEAIDWTKGRKVGKTAWAACPRGDWLLWIAAHLGVDRSLILIALVNVWRSEWAKYATDAAHQVIDLVERRVLDDVVPKTSAAANGVPLSTVAPAWKAMVAARAVEVDARSVGIVPYVSTWIAGPEWIVAGRVGQRDAAAVNRRVSALVRARIPWAAVASALKDRSRSHERSDDGLTVLPKVRCR